MFFHENFHETCRLEMINKIWRIHSFEKRRSKPQKSLTKLVVEIFRNICSLHDRQNLINTKHLSALEAVQIYLIVDENLLRAVRQYLPDSQYSHAYEKTLMSTHVRQHVRVEKNTKSRLIQLEILLLG